MADLSPADGSSATVLVRGSHRYPSQPQQHNIMDAKFFAELERLRAHLDALDLKAEEIQNAARRLREEIGETRLSGTWLKEFAQTYKLFSGDEDIPKDWAARYRDSGLPSS